MPKMFMAVTDDLYELPLAPPFPSAAAAARWCGMDAKSARRGGGSTHGMRFVEVVVR